jgi:S1-C subfamily serine protease
MAVFEAASPAVVYISTIADSSVSSFLDVNVSIGTGSGFFVSSDGYICTNNHVISGSTSITVTTSEGTKYNATVVGTDQENDIAVLKINNKGGEVFPYLSFASSESLVVGQRVLAIGNPFGYDRTMAEGIISGLSRPIRDNSGNIMLGMIQTDATINPGNSGGPLLDTKGRVIGVCAEIYTSTGTSDGMNFAIAADTANSSVQDLIKYGKVNRGWIDIVPVQLSSQIVEYAGLKVDKGILVSQLVPNGKAQAAGMRGGTQQVMYGSSVIYLGGDVITSVNGMEVSEYSDLFNAMSNTRPGDKVTVIVNRNGSQIELKVELVERTSELVGWINR